MSSNLSKSAKADALAACFDQLLDFHLQIVQAWMIWCPYKQLLKLLKPQMLKGNEFSFGKQHEEYAPFLYELMHNSMDQHRNLDLNLSKRRSVLHKLIAVIPKKSDQKTSLGKHLRLIPNPKAALKKKKRDRSTKLPFEATENDENIKLASCILSNTIKVGKQVETEATNWFMDFLGKSFRNRSEETKRGQ
ncbi:hypothetical protein VitviT2T_022812 [Vitis vinifera]|uniref:Uncharacterized protein n=2 Tax=Vitis vinifera TaxID=29760 RepID=A0ABY9DB40_VITVI|nr:hypothetical protein VitviT2T_022812 [Vitis vinifera]